MTRTAKWSFGSLWVDNTLPVAIGVLCALIIVREGGPIWASLVVPALCWCVWQLARWLEGQLVIRVLLVASLTVVITVCFFLFFGVDTAKLREAVSDAGIGVKAVSSDGNAIIVRIRPVSWGPERNTALRAIFAATHAHARSKKRVIIQWGDAMTTTVKLRDVEAFVAGHITYREMINRMDWSGTPDVLPEDSTSTKPPTLLHNTSTHFEYDDGKTKGNLKKELK
jgi:hypothetical protein